MTLDVQTKDRIRSFGGFLWGMSQFHTSGLASATHLDLGFNHHSAAELGSCLLSLCGGSGNDAFKNRHAVLFEKISSLVLVKIHVNSPFGLLCVKDRDVRPAHECAH